MLWVRFSPAEGRDFDPMTTLPIQVFLDIYNTRKPSPKPSPKRFKSTLIPLRRSPKRCSTFWGYIIPNRFFGSQEIFFSIFFFFARKYFRFFQIFFWKNKNIFFWDFSKNTKKQLSEIFSKKIFFDFFSEIFSKTLFWEIKLSNGTVPSDFRSHSKTFPPDFQWRSKNVSARLSHTN